MKKIITLVTVLTLGTLLIAGCNSGGTSKDIQKYSAHFDAASYDSISTKSFFPKINDAACIDLMPSSGNQSFADYTLEISDNSYTLTADYYTGDPDTGKRYEVGDDSGIAITVTATATGKVKESTNDSITIESADFVTYSIPENTCDAIGKEQMAPMFSFAAVDAETACGSWTSEDISSLLDAVPETTFTIDNSQITGWK